LAPRRPVIFYDQLGSLKSPVKNAGQRLGTFDLLGHSWDGALAVEYALKHPERVHRLVLASPLLSTPLWKEHSQRPCGASERDRAVLGRHCRISRKLAIDVAWTYI